MPKVRVSKANALVTAGRFDALPRIMIKRRAQVSFRLAMMTLMVVFFSRYLSLVGMLSWAAVYSVIAAWELLGLPFTEQWKDSSIWRLIALATLALNSIVFGMPAVIWTEHGGSLGLVCGAYMLSGAILNTVLTTRESKEAFLASAAPFAIYVLVGALLAGGQHFEVGATVTVLIAGTMMLLCSVSLWLDASRTYRSEISVVLALADREVELSAALVAAEKASTVKSAFLANMSHELRTPLNGVLGMASMLARTKLTKAQKHMVEAIEDGANHLQALVADVLDLADMVTGVRLHAHEAASPASIARTASARFQQLAARKGLAFEVDLDEQSELLVMCDRPSMTRILEILCDNAVKFTAQGIITLSVRATLYSSALCVSYTVSDTGVGISQYMKDQLFERFAQADTSLSRRSGGAGLGLAIAKKLCDSMGGSISVDSQEGVGSTITIAFDCIAPAAFPGDGSDGSASKIEGLNDCLRPKVLLVEDHPANRKVVELMLAEIAELDVAVDGAEGAEAASVVDYDLILMDMQMPVMDGIAATRAIRARERLAGKQRTPIIMLTANAMTEHVRASLEAGADRHVAKPVTFERLIDAMDEVLSAANDQVADEGLFSDRRQSGVAVAV